MEIVTAGHLCLDIIPKWGTGSLEAIQPGKLVVLDGVAFATGGAVSNTGISLKRLGLSPILIGRVGDDHLGEIVRRIYAEEGVAAQHLVVCPGATTSYTIVLNPPESDRAFLHYPGTNDQFSPDDVDFSALPQGLFHFGYPPLMAQMYKERGSLLVELFQKAKSAGMVTSLDMAMPDPNSPAGRAPWREILRAVLPYVDVFLPSIDELMYMLGRSRAATNLAAVEEAAAAVLEMGTAVVGIKLGDQGLYLETSPRAGALFGQGWAERQLMAPCFRVDVQGTTGAGDATIAGFLAALAEGRGPEETLTLAVAVGAHCVEALSATAGIPHLGQVEGRIEAGWPRRPVALQSSGWQTGKKQLLVGPRDMEG
ncbi:MAG: carbohydrate kinase family protein [Firmicutes bacterium]|jgi:sugar/nucleoside kinase (ribokinase family)|nr:carbohydrate kinase family protein [Bacillota bacterium]